LLIDKFKEITNAMNMNVEPIDPANDKQVQASPAIGFLNILLTVIWWAGWAFMILFVFVSLYAVLAFLGVEAVQKSFEVTTPFMALISSVSVVVVAAVFLVIVRQLRQICQTLATGDPFVPENAKRLRVIWIAAAAGEILRLVSTFLISWVSKAADGPAIHATDLRVYVWFMVLAVIILAEVFREGARMRQDAKLTV
jgi:Protein of unknown function (DUF2975)